MKTSFDHNFSKSANGQFLQKASATATSDVSNTNREIAKFNQKTLFSAIYSGVQNAAAPSLLELLELLTPGAKKNCCMLNYLQMFIAPKLCAINADPSENLHTSSTDRDWDLIKIWTQTVLITKSYDQNKFSIVLLKENAFFFLSLNAAQVNRSPHQRGGYFWDGSCTNSIQWRAQRRTRAIFRIFSRKIAAFSAPKMKKIDAADGAESAQTR